MSGEGRGFWNAIFGKAAVYLGANLLNAGIPFVLLPILTRVLTPIDYGIVAMFGIVLSVLAAFTGLSVHGAVGVRYFQLSKEKLAEYIGACLAILMVSTVAVVVVVLAFRHALAAIAGVPVAWLSAAVVLSGVQMLATIRLSLWQAAGQARRYGAFQVSQSVTNAAGSLVLVLLAGLAWQGRVLGQVIAICTFGVLALVLLAREGLIRKPERWRAPCADALAFGVPLIPHTIGALATATGGQFLVTSMFGVSGTGLYVVGAQIGSAMGIVSDAFVKTYGPWLYAKLRDDSADERHFVVGVTYCLLAAFLLLSAIASVAVYFVFPFLVGSQFDSARPLTTFFVFANGFIGMYYAVAGFFFFSSKTHLVSIVTITSGVLSIVVMWVFGRIFGLQGVAVGYLASQAITFMLAWLVSNTAYRMPWLQFRAAFTALSSRLS